MDLDDIKMAKKTIKKKQKIVKKEAKVFDCYKNKTEHNKVVGLMIKFHAVGLATDIGQHARRDDVLYMNHLLDGLRK